MPYRMLLFAATFQNGCRSQTALQFLSFAVESFNRLLKERNNCFLPYISHHDDSCASYVQTEAVLPHTGERQCNVWKLHFVHTTSTLPYPPPLDLQALNSSLSVRILCASEWTAQCLVVLQLGTAGGHTRLQSFCFNCWLSQGVQWHVRCS